MTAKNFISFRINIAPFLPPDVTPPAVTAQPSPATSDPVRDWEKGVKLDMSVFRELKDVKEWDQWDTQFRTDVATQGLSSVLDSNFRPQTFKDKVLFHEQQMSDLAINDGEDDALQFSVANEADFNIDSDPMTRMTKQDQPSNEREPSSHKVNVHDTTVYDSIVANAHLLDYGEATDDAKDDAVGTEVDESNDEGDQTLHAFLASRGNNPSPADVRNVLSTSLKRVPGKLPKDHQVNVHITYAMDKCHMDKPGSLIDHGANGGMAGADEWEMLPHVHWTRDSDWDPAIFNHEFGDNDEEWDDPVMDHRDLFDKVGNYRNRQGVDAGEVRSSRQIEVTIS